MLAAVAYAMGSPAGGAAPAGGGGIQQYSGMIMMVIILAIFYFIMVLPQQKQAKKHKEMLDNLKKGDQVMTNAGIYGTIYSLTENLIVLIVNEGGMKIKVNKGYIAGLATPNDAEASTPEKTS